MKTILKLSFILIGALFIFACSQSFVSSVYDNAESAYFIESNEVLEVCPVAAVDCNFVSTSGLLTESYVLNKFTEAKELSSESSVIEATVYKEANEENEVVAPSPAVNEGKTELFANTQNAQTMMTEEFDQNLLNVEAECNLNIIA